MEIYTRVSLRDVVISVEFRVLNQSELEIAYYASYISPDIMLHGLFYDHNALIIPVQHVICH